MEMAGQEEDLAALGLGPIPGGADVPWRGVRSRDLPAEGQVWMRSIGAKVTCVVHHDAWPFLGNVLPARRHKDPGMNSKFGKPLRTFQV